MLKQVDLGGYCLNTGITEVLSKKKKQTPGIYFLLTEILDLILSSVGLNLWIFISSLFQPQDRFAMNVQGL